MTALFPPLGIRILVDRILEGADPPWHQVDEWTIICSPSFFEELKARVPAATPGNGDGASAHDSGNERTE